MKIRECIKSYFDPSVKPTARVVGKDIIISLPDAMKPSVWKTNLEEVKSASFEVEQENALYVLVMKDKAGQEKREVINSYEKRDAAVNALNIISKALLSAPTVYASTQGIASVEEKPLGFFKSFIIFLALFFIFYFIAGMFVNKSSDEDMTPAQEVQLGKKNEQQDRNQPEKTRRSSPVKEGVPLSADELLGGGR